MIVVVADDGVNAATPPQEALAHISAVHPFIELPDLVSLRSFGPLLAPKPGLKATVAHERLAESPKVSVSFE